jgi:hypothetical protein
MGQHVFFRQENQNKNTEKINPKLQHNLVVMEICNNWEIVKELYIRIERGEVDLLNPLEATWVQFLSGTNTNIQDFDNESEFESKMIKTLG